MKIDDFNYFLPPELIAKDPVEKRDNSKLLKFNSSNSIDTHKFSQVIDFLNEGDVLVFNDSKVIPAYFEIFHKSKKLTFNIVNIDFDNKNKEFDILAKPSKIIEEGDELEISDDFKLIVDSKDSNSGVIKVKYLEDKQEFLEKLEISGNPPLPPYILKKRGLRPQDKKRYQTVYAKEEGSVAAPTAGLHFTGELLKKIQEKGVITTNVTLHVGGGTFLPVKVDNIKEHRMHSEIINVSRETSGVINKAKKEGKKIICVGTTSLRTLESAVDKTGSVQEITKSTDIFIYPGFDFKIVDSLITNFHLPKSTLLMLVAAFIGKNDSDKIYKYAVDNKLRFFSYGDACFLERL